MGGYGWGHVQENELIEAVHAALDCGITMFDTADTYGLGQSEKTLGKALGRKRNGVVIADKFGVRVGKNGTVYDNSPKYIREALDASLTRLKTDYIDLYQVHYRDDSTPLAEVINVLDELKKSGKIRYYGLSNIHESDYDEIRPYVGKIVSIQDEYSLACRKNEKDLLELCSDFSISPLTWGSLGQGILTGKYTKDNIHFESNDRRSRATYVNFHGEKLVKNLEIVETIKVIAQKYNKPVSAVAIRFILDYIPDSVVLFGAKRLSHVFGNVEASDWRLDDEDIKALDTISN